jgi:hypothetical protein
MMRLFLIAVFFMAAAEAFAPPFARRHVSTKLNVAEELSDIDLMCIENVASLCTAADSALEGCDIEEYEALTNQLKDQRAIMQKHLDKIDVILGQLTGTSGWNQAGTDE